MFLSWTYPAGLAPHTGAPTDFKHELALGPILARRARIAGGDSDSIYVGVGSGGYYPPPPPRIVWRQ